MSIERINQQLEEELQEANQNKLTNELCNIETQQWTNGQETQLNPNANSYIQFNDVQGPYIPNRHYVNSQQANYTKHLNQHSNRQYNNRFNVTQSNSYSQQRRQPYTNRNNNFVNYQQLYPNYQQQQYNNPQHLQQLVSNSSTQLQHQITCRMDLKYPNSNHTCNIVNNHSLDNQITTYVNINT